MDNQGPERLSYFGGLLLLAAVAIPICFFMFQNHIRASGPPISVNYPVASFDQSETVKFERLPLIPTPEFGQQYTNVQVMTSATGSGETTEILATDALRGQVIRLVPTADGQWEKTVLNTDWELPAPARVTPVDLDQDGDRDFLVCCIGGIQPTNDLIGRVVWLRNDGGKFSAHDVLNQVRRVTDAQVGDFDGDGDIDMVVAVFGGLLQGQILWLENDGKQNFTDHEIMNATGTIHVPVRDFDNDGDLDFAAIVTQEDEQVWVFENLGNGFNDAKHHLVFSSWNFDLGGAGMTAVDLDQDGDQDLLMALGDNLELLNNSPQPSHGVKWLENVGDFKFEAKQLATIGGVYGVSPGDLDGDGDTDIAVVTMFNDFAQENAASVLWLENDGQQNFKTWQIAGDPIQLATVDCGDLDGDGDLDIVTGSMHFRRPFHRFGSIDAFMNQKGANQ